MKTPYEIKKGLECCAQSEPCVDCVYDRRDFPMCVRRMAEDALAYILQIEAAHRTEYCEDADYDCKMLGDARKRIQQLENHIGELTEKVAQLEAAQQKWISVEDRLPEPNTTVLLIAHGWESQLVYIGKLEKVESEKSWLTGLVSKASEWTVYGFSYLKEPIVTHWMPIPSTEGLE